jgi:hypothetical protein
VARQGTYQRRNGTPSRMVCMFLPVEVYRALKLHCTRLDCLMKDFVASAIDEKLRRARYRRPDSPRVRK